MIPGVSYILYDYYLSNLCSTLSTRDISTVICFCESVDLVTCKLIVEGLRDGSRC